MAVSIESLRRFAGADPEEDDSVLTACLEAAMEWYAGAGVPQDTTGALYDFYVQNLAAYFYDSRGTAEPGAHIPDEFTSSLHMLRAAAGR